MNDLEKIEVSFNIPACRRTIFISNEFRLAYGYEKRHFFLSFPEILFKSKLYLDYFGKPIISSEVCFISNKEKMLIPLPNIKGFSICIGNYIVHEKRLLPIHSKKDKEEFIKFLTEMFWNTEFSLGFSGNYNFYGRHSSDTWFDQDRKLISNLNLWEQRTKFDFNWVPNKDCLFSLNDPIVEELLY